MGKSKNKRRKKKNPNGISRRQFIIGLGCIATGGAIGLLATSDELDFRKAKQNPRLRQEYVEKVVKWNPPPTKDLVVEYDDSRDFYPNPLLNSGGMVMRTGFTVPEHSEGIVRNPRTIIYRGAFNNFLSEDEFLSGLVDHEYEHTNLTYNGINLTANPSIIKELQERAFDTNGDLFEIFQELYAFNSQINAFARRENLSDSFKNGITSAYKVYRSEVKKKRQTPLTEWLLENFPRH